MRHIESILWALLLLTMSMVLPSSAQAEGGHRLTVTAKPAMAGSFNTNAAELVAGQSIQLVAYANANFTFLRWTDDKGNVVSQKMDLTYVMPAHDVTLTAEYEYNPANPANPARNYWNKELGEVIVDDFTTGSLQNAVKNVIGDSKATDVMMITVAGIMNSNDFGIINNYSACTLLDLSRVTGITQVPSYAFDYTKLESVYLPATIEKIGYRAFYECKQLSSLIVYAMTPPALENNVFTNVPDGLVVYVPAAAIAQYQDAAGWKDFTLLPIQEDIRSISVSLPEGVNAADYAQMWLELTNTKSGQRMHYVMTDRQQYTFANIIRNTSWNVTLRNERGDVFGQIDNVEVKDEDVSVVFSTLSKPQSVSLAVKTPDGQDVTAQTQITWTDAQGNYVAQGESLTGLPVGYQANYRVALSQELAMQYVTPQMVEYVLKDGDNSIVYQLEAIKQLQITGKVKDAATGLPLSGAVVSASQTFGGKYSKTLNAKTDNNGVFTLTIANVPTSVAFAASDYVSQTVDFNNNELDELNEFTIPDVSLKSITGATISIGFSFTTVEGETQNWYSDYQNVSYELFNMTKNRAVSQYNVQYPQIVLLEEIEDGDVLRLTATSRTNAFMPVTATATIAEQKAEATFAVVELGKILSSFTTTGNVSVVGSLYDAAGKLVKTYDYANASLTINDLADGQYTLVSMGSSRLFNTIYDLAQLPQTGLTEGTDYVVNAIEVKSGAISQISIDEVPTLDESKLYYTGDNTSFTVNKPSIVAGNYLTLTGRIDFKPAYATSVSNVQMIVDMPESCEFVENSVMVGNSTSSYTLNGNRITIPMTRYTDRVRFCIIPTLGGDYTPSAFVQFDLDGETVTQPIGSANYTAKDLSISVPSTVAKTTIPVSGTAIGTSNIEIYDNGVLIGQTTSMANGTWATTCELNEPYNLSRHQIYARVTTKQGIELTSENVSCVYDMNAIQIQTVTMYHYNPEMHTTFESVFDFQNPHTTSNKWTVYYPNKKFTYTVDFTNNSPEKVSNVILYVHAADGQIVPLYPTYDEKKDIWVADIDMGNRSDGYYPVNVSVDYNVVSDKVADRKVINDVISDMNDMVDEQKQERVRLIEDINSDPTDNPCFAALELLLEKDDSSLEEIASLVDQIVSDSDIANAVTFEELFERFQESESIFDNWQVRARSILQESIDEILIEPSANFADDFNYSQEYDDYVKTCEKKKIESIEVADLENKGFKSFQLTDGSNIYYNYSENGKEIIDAGNMISYRVAVQERQVLSWQKNFSRRGMAGYVECGRRAIDLMKDLYANRNQNSSEQLLANITIIGEIANSLSCYYEGLREDMQYLFDKKQKERTGEFQVQIDNQNNIKVATENSLKASNKECKALNQEWKQLVNSYNEVAVDNSLSPEVKASKLEAISNQIDTKVSRINQLKKSIASETQFLKKINKNIAKLEKQLEAVKDNGKLLAEALNKCPIRIVRGVKIPPFLRISGNVAGDFGTALQAACIILDCFEVIDDLNAWQGLIEGIEYKIPCEANPNLALDLQQRINDSFIEFGSNHIATLFGELTALGCSAAGGVFLSPTWWAEMIINAICEWSKMINLNSSLDAQVRYWIEIGQLRCKKDPDPTPNPNPTPKPDGGGGNGGGGTGSGSSNDDVQVDPSGYVYEGVFSNRVEGATATVFYKEMVEDMYGDLHENIVKWDAEEYAQENPLFTDENGFYRWDVPQGLWQVKFEKEGYETTYSEWLPVPPPQLDVNIAMKQNRQPEVKAARAYEDAVEVEFDKYMMPELLTAENISVVQNGTAVEGTVELLNEETAYEGSNESFASKVRFNAVQPFTEQKVTLLVNNRVKSYAGIRMQDNYQQTFTIEQEIKQVVSDSVVTVGYGNASTLTISVLPASASKGKMLTVKTSSPIILSVETEQVTIGNDGKAAITVSGELPGTAALTFSVEGTDKTAMTIANVEQIAIKTVATPKASVASGSTVEKGTAIALTCETGGATIYYTTDGTCPCDETGSRKVYDGTPIIINESMTIKAMAVAPDMYESEVAEFTFIVDDATGINEVTLNDEIQVYPLPVRDILNLTANGKIIKSVTVSSMNGVLVASANKAATKVTLNISTMPTGIYIINVVTESGSYSRKILKVN